MYLCVLCGSENKQRLFPYTTLTDWFLDESEKFHKANISFVMSVRPSAQNNSAPTGRIFMKFNILLFFENLSRKFKFHYNLTTITGTLHEHRYTFLIISRSVLLRMRNISDKSCRENQNTLFYSIHFSSKILPFIRKCGKNIVQPDRPQMTIWRMRIACWMPKATDTHYE